MKKLVSKRRALLVSASFPMAALFAGNAQAQQVVTVDSTRTAADVNTEIATKIATPDPDLNIVVTSKGEVTNPGSPVLLVPAAGQGDGKIGFANGGKIGAVDAGGAVTDTVGVLLFGSGEAGNTLTATNSGLITGGFVANGFGGDISVSSSGSIYDGISLSGASNVSLTTTAAAPVLSGDVTVASSATVTVVDPETSTLSSGNVKIDIGGDVASADGATKGSVYGGSFGDTEVSVAGVAGNVTAYGGGAYTQVSKAAAPVADKTVTVAENSTTYTSGAASVTITDTASVDSVLVRGSSQTATIAGAVENNVSATSFTFSDTANSTDVTSDDKGNNTKVEFNSTSTPFAELSKVTVADTGTVGGNVIASSPGGAEVSIDGEVGNNVTVTATGSSNTNHSIDNYDAGGAYLGSSFENTTTSMGGTADLGVGEAGKIGGNVSVSGNSGATADVAGTVAGGLTLTSVGLANTSSGETVYDKTGPIQSQTSANSSTPTGGVATLTVASTGSIDGGVSANAYGGVAASVAGTLGGGLTATSTVNAATSESTTLYDAKGVQTSTSFKSTATAAGGLVDIAVEPGGSIGAQVFANGDSGVKVANGGTIADPGYVGGTTVSAVSSRTLTTLSSSELSDEAVTDGTKTTSASTTTSETLGGEVAVSNSGNLWGNVSAIGVDGVTIVNSAGAEVFGSTSATSQGVAQTTTNTSTTTSVTPVPVAPALAVTSTSTVSTYDYDRKATGGSVKGTYAGVNGALNFTGGVDGSIYQNADGDSTATVTGSVFGNVNSNAGTGYDQTLSQVTKSQQDIDTDGTGTQSASVDETETYSTRSGTSVVNVSGTVAPGRSGFAGSIDSEGTTGSAVTVAGTVDTPASVTGSITSRAYGTTAYVDTATASGDQTVTKGVAVTNNLVETESYDQKYSGGDASVSLSNAAVGSTVNVLGNASATGVVDAKSTVAGSLNVRANTAFDYSGSLKNVYARADDGTFTASSFTEDASGPSATSGNASATVAGAVSGNTNVSALRGDASVVLTGTTNIVNVNASGSVSKSSSLSEYSGKSDSGATSFGALPLGTADTVTTTNSNTIIGGKASVSIDTSSDFAGTSATFGVNAAGYGGATVDVSANSKVSGSVSASSAFTNTTGTSTTTNGATTSEFVSSGTGTVVGGDASVTNAGTITGTATASAVGTASVTNSGKAGGLQATSLFTNSVSETSDNDQFNVNPAGRTTVDKATYTAVGGTATATNSGLVTGSVFVAGKTGTVTNNGMIAGTTFVGTAVSDYSTTTTNTAGATKTTITQPATLFAQTYTVNQNGISRGIVVQGATSFLGGKSVQTSDITATINLNNGSATLGSISGQTDADGVRLTNTTVNLNGAGFLGADDAGDMWAPYLELPDSAVAAGFSTPAGVRVTGVETLNKTGAGTFVIAGSSYVASTGPGVAPVYTLDVGSFNINAGEVQLAVLPVFGGTDEFGIRGNLVNNATLVIGRRQPTATQLVGGSIVGIGPELISGVTVNLVGNFTQGSQGVTVMGVTPSLVRFGDVTVSPGSGSNEPLGVVQGGVLVPYFTTADNAGVALPESQVNVTGNLTLGGTVAVNVNRNQLFQSGDGTTLFTYTGTGTVTANAVSTLSSPFVKFSLVNDTAAKEVRVTATRSSFTGGATNPNAASAAAALDSALPSIVSRITADANGGAGFATVSEIGYAQDLANIITALDWRLDAAQAAEVFDELSSAEFYGSLSAVDQNVVFGNTVNLLANQRSVGAPLHTRLWVNPVGNFAKFSDRADIASRIKATSYGAAFGLDTAYSPTGVVGIGGAYAEHDVNARGTPEMGNGRTWTVGAYVSQGFGPIYINGTFAYGFSHFDTTRTLTLLSRTMSASFRSHQLDASLEAGYDLALAGATVTPFGKVAVRKVTFDGFTETGGGGAGLEVAKSSDSAFSPSLGVKLTGQFGDADGMSIRPYAKGYYTFSGDLSSDRSVQYLGGGSPFTLTGVRSEDYGTIEAGIEGSVNGRVSVFASGGYSFSGEVKTGTVRGGIAVSF